ncbi:MAG: ABC transporter substrate-binding protein [Nitrospira sp.]|jgi:putative ABC transport system substrate-binding protein|nr:ABC transporter substrate-binding protein [Nitrospira sp.]
MPIYGCRTAHLSHLRHGAAGQHLLALILALLASIFAIPPAQAAEIAILKSSDLPAYAQAIEGFKATAPASATYVEYDLRNDAELGLLLAKKIRASDAQMVLAVGIKAALAAKHEIADIPIVYMMILDPLKHRLTAPNMTGTQLEIPLHRQFKIIHTLLPSLRRLGVLFESNKSAARINDAVLQAAASGFRLESFPVGSEKDIPQQLRALLAEVEGLWLTPDSTVLTAESIRFILESALARHIPVIGFSPELTKLGALLSISIAYGDVGRETGQLAKRLLDGERILSTKPVPIERMTITVNHKTANFLGIAFPGDLERLIDATY